jgi:tetratricopeptide (TPR) repeat protein
MTGRILSRMGVGVVALAAAACSGAQADRATTPLYDDLGTHGYTIQTAKPEAQRYFDQGLRLYYAFNHAEAIRAFEQAALLDPACAMCYWGSALAHGPNINAPMDSAGGVAAYEATRKAQAAPPAEPRERALIDALAQRYAAVPTSDRAPLDSAYATALAALVQQYPDDHEIATLYAESIMDLSPWNYWTTTGEPRPQTPEVLALLEGVIAQNPQHPGACHFYIHAVEAARPQQAVPCAERLASLMPGAGHLVHMPAHIYIRVGRWADAVEANEHAVHTDESYIRDQQPAAGVYTLGYYPHNYHFLAFASFMSGRSERAITAARAVVQKVDPTLATTIAEFKPLPAYAHLALLNFGRWEDVLAEPMPAAELTLATALAHYARGNAFAATGREAEAMQELEQVRQAEAAERDEAVKPLLQIASRSLTGEIALRNGRHAEAIDTLRAAAAVEDEMVYIEPPLWFYPVRHSLGKALLAAGRAKEAEQVYEQDLRRFPENGWSLFGLEQSLRAQRRTADADRARQRFQQAWSSADVELTASRF